MIHSRDTLIIMEKKNLFFGIISISYLMEKRYILYYLKFKLDVTICFRNKIKEIFILFKIIRFKK